MNTTTGISLPPIVSEIIVKTGNVATSLRSVGKTVDTESRSIKNKLNNLGNNFNKIGNGLTLGLSVPLAGLGLAATKMAFDFESSFAKVATLLDSSKVDYNKYKKDILNASNDANIAVGEFAEAVYGSISAGVEQKKAIGFTTKAMKLAKGGFTSGAKAVDILTTAINGYKLSAEDTTKISDLLITTQNEGKLTVDELAVSMGRVIPIASSANFNIEELSTSYAVLTKNGIATAEAGTYLKSMLSEITKTGSEADKALKNLTKKGFSQLKKEGVSTSEILKMLQSYAESNGKTLKDMFGSVEAGTAALILASQNGEEYNEILEKMSKSAGATQEAFEKIDATPSEKLARSINRIKNKSIELGAKLLPVFEKIFDKVQKGVDYFTSLDDSTQALYLKWGAGLIAAGPLIKGLGSILSISSKIPKAFSLAKTGIGLLSKGALPATAAISNTTTAVASASAAATASSASLGAMAGAIGGVVTAAAPFVFAGAAVAAGGYAIYKGFEENATPAVDRFADTVITTGIKFEQVGFSMVETAQQTTVKFSEETKKRAGAFFELSDKAQQATIEMYAGIIPLTSEGVKQITSLTGEMANTVISDITKQKDESIANYQEIFSSSTTLTQEQKTQILQDVDTMANERIKKITSLKDELEKLYIEIKDNGVENSKQAQQRISEIYDELAKEEIRAVAKSKNEQEALLDGLKRNKEQVTSKMLEDTIKKINENRQKAIELTQDEYQKRLNLAAKYKTDIEITGQKMTDVQKSNYQALIKEAENYKNESTKNYENLRNGAIKKLYDAFPELTKSINIETGKQLSFFEKLFGGAKKNADKINSLAYEDKSYTITRNEVTRYSAIDDVKGFRGSHHANGLDYVPHDGYYARLHRGERVLTEKENKEYSKNNSQSVNISIGQVNNNTKEDVRSLVKRLGEEIKRQNLGRGQFA